MSFKDWVRESVSRIEKDGIRRGVHESAYEFWIGALGRLHWIRPGTPVYEKEWDVLVILDGCRVDLMEEVIDEYDFLSNFDTISSSASTSREWMQKNFSADHRDAMRETVYVTSNLYSEKFVNPNDFAEVEEVWRTEWDESLGTIPPRKVTDSAIRHGRQTRRERMIVHYMQPHYPFIPYPDLAPGMQAGEGEKNIWKQLRDGEVTETEVWKAYRENLRHVLNDVRVLLQNLDAETVVITSDHGNSLGETGVFGHPYGVPISSLREVPWVKTTANDTGEYVPKNTQKSESISTEEKLSALGYKE